jgi:hypothetical protein
LERHVIELFAVIPAVAAGLIGTRSIMKLRTRQRRSERRRLRYRREAGIWWASMWLAKDKRQKKLTHRQD